MITDDQLAGAIQKTGGALTFEQWACYGSIASPVTGNITASIIGALSLKSVLVVHNDSTPPTIDPTKFHLLSGSGTYVINVPNYIFCTYLDATHILYSINQ